MAERTDSTEATPATDPARTSVPSRAVPLISRRSALRAAALTSGGALVALALPSAALAQDETDDEADFLAEAIDLSYATALAYDAAAAAKGAPNDLRAAFERFAAQERAHAEAFVNAFELVSTDDPPSEPESPSDTDLLTGIGDLRSAGDYVDFLVGLEGQQVTLLIGGAADRESASLIQTLAEVTASAAQHMAILRGLAGEPPARVVPDAIVEPTPDTATDPDASSSDGGASDSGS